MGRFSEAEQALRQAVRLKPNSPEVRYHLGVALELQGRIIEAREEYETYLHLSPNAVNAAVIREKLAKLAAKP